MLRPRRRYALGDCLNVTGDTKRGSVAWVGGPTIPASPSSIRLRFVLLRARLYSYGLA